MSSAASPAGSTTSRSHPAPTPEVIESLGAAGLASRSRIILEKPFGTDLASASELDDVLHRVFDEAQIFRIDHYLGRDAVQNLLAMRFANGMYEPVWNRNHISHVQIDVPETLGIGMRAEFYEQTGAFRDMVVTHLFQVLGFVAMEPPNELTSKSLMAERQKVFDAMLPVDPSDVVRGQYDGYREEDGVAPGLGHRDLRRAHRIRRQLALGRHPVPAADGEADGAVTSRPHRLVQPAAAADVPGRHQALRRHIRLRPPDLRARRPGQHLGELPRQAPGTDAPARPGAHAVQLRRGLRRRRAVSRRIRAADPRRDGRTPHLLHDLGRGRAPVGGSRTAPAGPAAARRATSRAPGDRRPRTL